MSRTDHVAPSVRRPALRVAVAGAVTVVRALVLTAAVTGAATAQTPAAAPAAPEAPPPIPHARVAQALAALQARDGQGVIVVHTDGWTLVTEPLASAQWSFVPAGHEAHPAVVRRTIQRGPGGAVAVDLALLCEAPPAACERLRAQFAAMNDRIVQAVRARGGGSGRSAMPPPQPPAVPGPGPAPDAPPRPTP